MEKYRDCKYESNEAAQYQYLSLIVQRTRFESIEDFILFDTIRLASSLKMEKRKKNCEQIWTKLDRSEVVRSTSKRFSGGRSGGNCTQPRHRCAYAKHILIPWLGAITESLSPPLVSRSINTSNLVTSNLIISRSRSRHGYIR